MKLKEIAIFTDRVDEVADFYESLLGSAPVHRGPGIAIFRAETGEILIHRPCEAGPDEPPCENHVAFAVPDLDAAVGQLAARGVSLIVAPRQYDWGRSAYLRDPAGGLLELWEEGT